MIIGIKELKKLIDELYELYELDFEILFDFKTKYEKGATGIIAAARTEIVIDYPANGLVYETIISFEAEKRKEQRILQAKYNIEDLERSLTNAKKALEELESEE